MAGTTFIFGLLIILIPILSIQIDNINMIHYRYMIERSLRSAMVSSYKEDTETAVFNNFKEEFFKYSPDNFTYTVSLINFEEGPKLIHFKVLAVNDNGLSIELEETLIEEDLNENSS